MNIKHLLETPSPHYCMGRGDKCYLVMDAAHGGAVFPAEIICPTLIGPDNADAYKISYREQTPPYATFEGVFPVVRVFADLDDVDAGKRKDTSVREAATTSACSDATGLVLFLLDRADLRPEERRAAIDRAKALGMYPAEKDGENRG